MDNFATFLDLSLIFFSFLYCFLPPRNFRGVGTSHPEKFKVACPPSTPHASAACGICKYNIVDASIKQISDQSTTVVKCCMYKMLNVVDNAFSYCSALVVCLFLRESFKVKESSLNEI